MSNSAQTHPQKNAIIVWFTGLSGSGKTTIAQAVNKELQKLRVQTLVLDGDNTRENLCADLSFSDADRSENIRRIACVNKLFASSDAVILNAFIAPFAKDRALAKQIINQKNFIEVYCDCPLSECKNRDTKGLYQQVKLKKIQNFTGIDSTYEIPDNPDLRLTTDTLSITQCTALVMAQLKVILSQKTKH